MRIYKNLKQKAGERENDDLLWTFHSHELLKLINCMNTLEVILATNRHRNRDTETLDGVVRDLEQIIEWNLEK